MPASIFGERFAGRREPAWHKLGQVFGADEQLTATEAMQRAGVLFNIDKYPQKITLPDGTDIDTGAYAIVREPTTDDPEHRVFGTVGKDWTALQATELGTMLDPMTEQLPVETVGALGQGEKIFISLDAGESNIAGEHHKLYWLVTDHRDGTGTLSIAFTPVRVVCQNTLITGLDSAKVSVNLRHKKSIKTDTSFYIDIFSQMAQTQETVVNELQTLTQATLTQAQQESIIMTAYPNPKPNQKLRLSSSVTRDDVPASVWTKLRKETETQAEEYQRQKVRMEKIREGARERIDVFNQEYSQFANTGYAVYQGIVECEDYRRGWEGSGTAVFGARAKTKARAFNKTSQLVRASV